MSLWSQSQWNRQKKKPHSNPDSN